MGLDYEGKDMEKLGSGNLEVGSPKSEDGRGSSPEPPDYVIQEGRLMVDGEVGKNFCTKSFIQFPGSDVPDAAVI